MVLAAALAVAAATPADAKTRKHAQKNVVAQPGQRASRVAPVGPCLRAAPCTTMAANISAAIRTRTFVFSFGAILALVSAIGWPD